MQTCTGNQTSPWRAAASAGIGLWGPASTVQQCAHFGAGAEQDPTVLPTVGFVVVESRGVQTLSNISTQLSGGV